MSNVRLTIDDITVEAEPDTSILEAARKLDIYIPTICSHPDLPPDRDTKLSEIVYWGKDAIKGIQKEEFEGCNLCLVEVDGLDGAITACNTNVKDGMVVRTNSQQIKEQRKLNLMPILANHPRACLTCAQVEGCAREPCSANIPMAERCCPKLGNCELQKVAEYIGIRDDTARYVPRNLPIIKDEPLFERDYNLCIACARCVRACRDLRGVDALAVIHNGNTFIVGTRQSTLNESECRYCGACVEVCPTGALTDKDLKTREEFVRCTNSCPVAKDIPRILRLVSQGNYSDAVAVMREKVPFVYSLGNICFHPCEEACNRSQVNEAIAICALERFVAANQQTPLEPVKIKDKKDKRVAIVGAGPAGLTCAYYLQNLGYKVTVYEAMPEPGGMLRYSIPDFRLPKDILQKDIDFILGSGFDLKLNQKIGDELSLKSLKDDNDAVFLALGAQLSKRLNVEGIDLEGILWGLDFLNDVKKGRDISIRKKIVVIGGGNVAIDVALTARRMGVEDIQLACLESDDEMPAFDWEIKEATEEGIGIHTSWGPKRVIGEDGKVSAIELMRCTSVFDEDGKFNPTYVPDTTKTLSADMIIFAIGQSSDFGLLEGTELESPRGLLEVEQGTLETPVKGIFAGGEVVSGPASVIDSIALGRKAASAIDRYLGGDGTIDESFIKSEEPNPWLGREEGFANRKRSEMPRLSLEERIKGFDEIELGFDEESAKREAERCLRCDLRLRISTVPLPPEKWLAFNQENILDVPQAEGVIQLLDEEKKVIFIAGRQDIRAELEEQLGVNEKARYFGFEEDKMYTQRESELLQQHLQKHGKLPELNDELDDLF